MINSILKKISVGIEVIQSNSKVLMISGLVFVFPLIFLQIAHGFFNTANTNIATIQKQKLDLLHNSISQLIQSDFDSNSTIQPLIELIDMDNQDVVEITVSERQSDDLFVLFSTNREIIQTNSIDTTIYNSRLITENDSIILFEQESDGSVWESYRLVVTEAGEYYIYSKHDFSYINSVLFSRLQQSYLVLTLIFLFLIWLAYWVNQQTFWQKEFQKKQKEIEERDMFSNMIAHEFRTPLTAIRGYASFLAESKEVTGEDKRFVGNIELSTERLIYLVNDFLEVARLQSGKIVLNKESVNLQEISDRVKNELLPIAEGKNLTIETSVNEKLTINSDSKRIFQILVNIVNNSIKYTKTGKIVIASEQKNHDLFIYVQDSGVGISGPDQKKLFKPFSRVGGADASDITGTGLGMWITQQLVELLNADISVESIEGIGTRVVLKFEID